MIVGAEVGGVRGYGDVGFGAELIMDLDELEREQGGGFHIDYLPTQVYLARKKNTRNRKENTA